MKMINVFILSILSVNIFAFATELRFEGTDERNERCEVELSVKGDKITGLKVSGNEKNWEILSDTDDGFGQSQNFAFAEHDYSDQKVFAKFNFSQSSSWFSDTTYLKGTAKNPELKVFKMNIKLTLTGKAPNYTSARLYHGFKAASLITVGSKDLNCKRLKRI